MRNVRLRTARLVLLLGAVLSSSRLGATAPEEARELETPGFSLVLHDGSRWWAELNPDGTVARALGSGTRVHPGPVMDSVTALAAADRFLREQADLLGAGSDNLRLLHCTRVRDLWIILFRQEVDALPVFSSQVDLRIHASGVLSLFGARSMAAPTTRALPPRVSAPEALSLALDALGASRGRGTLVETPVLELLPEGHTAWRVEVTLGDPLRHLRVHVDAGTGDLLRVHDETMPAAVTGTLVGTVAPSGPVLEGRLVDLPLGSAFVKIAGDPRTTTTDAAGGFVLETEETGPVEVVVRVAGPWVNVDNPTQGGDLVLRSLVSPGEPTLLHLNGHDIGEFVLAQVNALHHTNRVHDWMRSVVPGLTQIDRQILCRVNIGHSCNGFYVRDSINFDHARGNCRNTAYDTFIYHEYAHFADDRIGGLQNGSHAEGMADIVASFLSGQPGIGVGVRGGTTSLRRVDGNARWPALECDSSHCIGLTAAGFAWDVRAELMKSLGDDAGRALAEQLFISTLLANNRRIPELVTEVFLIDDDNGNLLDGTPHDEILHARAANRGFLHVPRIPRVDSVHPLSAPTSRATRVLLTGRGFAFPETEVRIGGERAPIVEKFDDNRLAVLSPLSSAIGAVDLVVTNRYGEARLMGQFLFTDEAWLEVPPVLTPGTTTTALVGGSPRSPYLLLASRHTGSFDLDPPGIEISLGLPVRVLHDALLGTDAPLDHHGLGTVVVRIPAGVVERLARAGLPPMVHLQAIVLLSGRELRTTRVATLSIGR